MDKEYEIIKDNNNQIFKESGDDYNNLMSVMSNLPSDKLDNNSRNQLAIFIGDVEDRILKNDKENVRLKALANKYAADYSAYVESNRNKKGGLAARELNTLEERKLVSTRQLREATERNAQALDGLKTVINEIKTRTNIKSPENDRIEEIVRKAINDDLHQLKKDIFEEIRTMLKGDKSVVMEQASLIEGIKKELNKLKGFVQGELEFLKREIQKNKIDSSELCGEIIEKTNNLEQYLDMAHEDFNRRLDSVIPIKGKSL